MSVAARDFLSIEDYFALEERSETKHEYVSGAIYAMAGARATHNRMTVRLVTVLEPIARSQHCETFVADMKLRIRDTLVYYPDVMVCCDPDDNDELFRRSPCLVVEVLSPSTAQTDRREKLAAYLAIPDLRAYLIVDPEVPMVEAHTRSTPDAPWVHQTVGVDGTIDLPCPQSIIDVSDLYP